jgi:hypothetical protein
VLLLQLLILQIVWGLFNLKNYIMWNKIIFVLFLTVALYNLYATIKISISKEDIECKNYKRKYHIVSIILFSLLALSRLSKIIEI